MTALPYHLRLARRAGRLRARIKGRSGMPGWRADWAEWRDLRRSARLRLTDPLSPSEVSP